MKDYQVVTQRGIHVNEIDKELANSHGSDTIPHRSCICTNHRKGSTRITHWELSEEEAELLRQDPRILSVQEHWSNQEGISIENRAIQNGDFIRDSVAANNINWGLARCISQTQNFTPDGPDSYPYALDGTGVDIVIQDSGIEPNHPEWEDANGVSRFQPIDWAIASGLGFTQSAGFYADYDGHGTHCAGIVAGKTYGWAKNARIYAQKLAGLEGTGDLGTGITDTFAFDAIRLWHIAKNGARPTVVNMSWGVGFNIANPIISGEYRGTPYNVTTETDIQLWQQYGIQSQIYVSGGIPYRRLPAQDLAINAEIEDMIDAGIHVCIAAGNDYLKADIPGNIDYDNFAQTNTGTYFYHRPSSPYSERAFIVGNIDNVQAVGNIDRPAQSSKKGPAVNIWAPGTSIMSTSSNNNNTFNYTQYDYPSDTSYKIMSISGTSMAAPQVAGLCALHLQANPKLSPADLFTKIVNDSQSVIADDQSGNNYTNFEGSLLSSENRMLYSKYGRQPYVALGASTFPSVEL